MAVAINTGLISPPNHIPSLVPAICPSGNCKFGMFRALRSAILVSTSRHKLGA
ncbi:hypothetical protein F4678DRAFT_425141 [Xylaria arbuscula]|nr:hypothetical protein F4678DRAFT_425141 [Xylaria arbuscula]